MADEKISELDPAGALTGAELVPVVQAGDNAQTTTQGIANLVSLSSLGASANGITLIGHTFAQMRADLDLEAGTDFYSISATDAAIAAVISDTAYNSGTWNGVTTIAPSKNAVRDQFEALSAVYQPLAANLTTWAGVAPSANGQSLVSAADYAAMRTLLGLVIGTNVQAYDADLTTWAGVTSSANGRSLVSAADYSAMRTLLTLVPGTDIQAYSAKTAALAAQTWAADTISYQTSTSAVSTTPLTSYARTLLDDADAATARTTLGLASGTYTPTLTNVANVDATTAAVCQYLRVGDVVTVSGTLALDATAAGTFTQVGISLPIASNLASVNQCAGAGIGDGGSNGSGPIRGDATNDRAELFCVPSSTSNTTWYIHFTYRII